MRQTYWTFLTAMVWPLKSVSHTAVPARISHILNPLSLLAVAIVLISYLFQSQQSTSVGLAWARRRQRANPSLVTRDAQHIHALTSCSTRYATSTHSEALDGFGGIARPQVVYLQKPFGATCSQHGRGMWRP
jgi:hypothetical protein